MILSLAFAVPAPRVEGQAYAGGKRPSGRGGAVTDFLCASASTGRLAIYPPSAESSQTIAQPPARNAKLQRRLRILKEASERHHIHDHDIRGISAAKRPPQGNARRGSVELLRSAMTGVVVTTVDELLAQLEDNHAALEV